MLNIVRQHLKTYWWILPLILLVWVQYRLWFDDSGMISNAALERKIAELQQDNAVQKADNDALINEVQELRDGELLEEKAREELGLVREGESFILFVDSPK